MIEFREASPNDLDNVMEFYNEMCRLLDNSSFLPNGNKGGYPPHDMVEDSIREGALFTGIENGRIVCAYILNHQCEEAYHKAHWATGDHPDDYVVLHALRVHPDCQRRGYARMMVEHAKKMAAKWKIKSIRLDVIIGNDIAKALYTSCGFQYVDTVDIAYPDIGTMKFRLFEYIEELV